MTNSASSGAPATSQDFDRAYRATLTLWGDVRIPAEIKTLLREHQPRASLELGCGIGRFSRYAAQQGVRATAVDFSPVAIERARKRVAGDSARPTFQVADVTQLAGIEGPFDVSFDVGCFHCLPPAGQRAYAAALARVLKPGGVHLIWALDYTPSDLHLSPGVVAEAFAPHFTLLKEEPSRRRLVASHWFWLTRQA